MSMMEGRESLMITTLCKAFHLLVNIPDSDTAAQNALDCPSVHWMGNGISSGCIENKDTAGLSWLWNWGWGSNLVLLTISTEDLWMLSGQWSWRGFLKSAITSSLNADSSFFLMRPTTVVSQQWTECTTLRDSSSQWGCAGGAAQFPNQVLSNNIVECWTEDYEQHSYVCVHSVQA